MDPVTRSVGNCFPGDTLVEGMFVIIPMLNDARLAGLQAEHGQFSLIWKAKLNAEYRANPDAFVDRVWDAGLNLLDLKGRIEHWCKAPRQ